MFETYPIYCATMNGLGHAPLSEEIYLRDYAPKVEERYEPMVITPRNKRLPIKPTLQNYAKVGCGDFTKTEDYYDYHEAQKILKTLRG